MHARFEVNIKAFICIEVKTSDYVLEDENVDFEELLENLEIEGCEIMDCQLMEIRDDDGNEVRDTSHNPASERY